MNVLYLKPVINSTADFLLTVPIKRYCDSKNYNIYMVGPTDRFALDGVDVVICFDNDVKHIGVFNGKIIHITFNEIRPVVNRSNVTYINFHNDNNPETIFMDYPINDIVFNKKNEKRDIGLTMFGSKTPERKAVVDILASNNIKINVYGEWDDFSLVDAGEDSAVSYCKRFGVEFEAEILNRAIANIVVDEHIKPVHFETIACGAILICNYNQDVASNKTMLDNAHIFSSNDEMMQIISDVKSGKIKSPKVDFTSDLFFDKLFDIING